MAATGRSALAHAVETALLDRNPLCESFFAYEAHRLALACQEMSERFLRGGRLLAFGRGASATDAAHVAVEFVHPVIVGKRALPALDLSLHFGPWLDALVRPDDMVMGFGPPEGDPDVTAALQQAQTCGAMVFAFPGSGTPCAFSPVSENRFRQQELVEILYHTLWESVHVFFEHREMGHDVGASGFLYPFLGKEKHDGTELATQVADSILMKVADDSALRCQVAEEESEAIAEAIRQIQSRIDRGGKLIIFGNGGSATDANDWAIDCVAPPLGMSPVPAISLSMEAASISAIANDVGTEVVFLRQLIAHAHGDDVAIAISTSGGSANVIMALEEARKRGLLTVALLGYDGGEIKRRGLADCHVVVRCDYIPRIQEIQASVYHVMREQLRGRADAQH